MPQWLTEARQLIREIQRFDRLAYVQTYFAPHMPKYGVRIANCARENWIHADRLRRKLVRLVKMNCH